jgi:hypothetical protein
MDEGEEKARRRQLSPFPRAAPEQDQSLPGEGEPESSTEALGDGSGGVVGRMRKERAGDRARGFINGRGVPVNLAEVVVVSWARVDRVSGGVAELGPGMRSALAFGWMQVARGGETGSPFRPVLSTCRCSMVGTMS